MSMNYRAVIRRFKIHHPANVEQALRKCLITLTYLDEGAYRRTYQIGNLPLVVKFPYIEEDTKPNLQAHKTEQAVEHSRVDIRALRTLRQRKYKPIHRYMPKVHYTNEETGVIVMRRYKPLRHNNRSCTVAADIANELSNMWRGHHSDDLDCDWYNLGRDEEGNVVILDFGLFEE